MSDGSEGGRGRRTEVRWLVAVAAAYVVVQLLTVGRVRFGWDETIYLSQVSGDPPAAFFSAPRARGISWLVAPVAVFTSDRDVIRGYLAISSGVGLVAAFWPWLRLRSGPVVPLAAGIVATLWPALFYGSEAMPNLWVAFAAVAAAGWFLLSVADPGAWRLAALAGSLAAVALFRPPDSGWLLLALAGAAVLVPAWRRWSVLATLSLAGMAGWAPWLGEAQTSFGGVRARLAEGSAIQGGTRPQFGVLTALRSVDGPLLCRPCNDPVPITGALFWVAGLGLVAVALLAARVEGGRGRTVLPAVTGAVMAVPYLFLLGYSAPRFLLPSYALFALPVAAGLLATLGWLRTGVLGRRGASVAMGGVLLGYLAYQFLVLAVVTGNASVQRNSWAALAAGLRARGVTPPCLVVGTQSAPIAFSTGCASYLRRGALSTTTAAGRQALAGGRPIAVVQLAGRRRPAGTRGWPELRVSTPYGQWVAYLSLPPRDVRRHVTP